VLRVVLAETEERQELAERLVPLVQLTMVLTETMVILVLMAQLELEVRQETQETLVLLEILEVLVAAGHEVMEELLEAEVMGDQKRFKAVSSGMQTMETLVLLMETEIVLVTVGTAVIIPLA